MMNENMMFPNHAEEVNQIFARAKLQAEKEGQMGMFDM